MHEALLTFSLAASASGLCFFAGLKWRDRRREREGDVIEAAICGLDERVRRIERVTLLSDDA